MIVKYIAAIIFFTTQLILRCFITDLARLQRTWPPAGTVCPPSHAERLCWEPTGGAWNQRRKRDLFLTHTKHKCVHIYTYHQQISAKALTKTHMTSHPIAFKGRRWNINGGEVLLGGGAESPIKPSSCPEITTTSWWPDATGVLKQPQLKNALIKWGWLNWMLKANDNDNGRNVRSMKTGAPNIQRRQTADSETVWMPSPSNDLKWSSPCI